MLIQIEVMHKFYPHTHARMRRYIQRIYSLTHAHVHMGFNPIVQSPRGILQVTQMLAAQTKFL